MSLKIDKNWTLFLDRDGVINERIPDDYVKSKELFHFIDGTLEAIKIFSALFQKIVVVTNQQGVGKGLMTIDELNEIHIHMLQAVEHAGGVIHKVYFSPYLKSEKHFTRKPSIGMGLLAKKDFKEISFKKSVMVGDSFGDILFGKRLGMKTVFIGSAEMARKFPKLVDFVYPDLITFAKNLR
ncbi:MAG: HAD-IIIA family hydrolase [Lentimicrobiaceae bacterium]|nr:HAD-IIIA family hydrolase [Lentimicrobiaceae bacterium]MCB9023200.1 HAD-IIIA family hydrolase [Lentimicrobiaceae bacterium]MCO5267101.1 HAD-IIIA family hydrolase [Lentimicrobium sp.]